MYSKVYLSGTKRHLLPMHDMYDTFDKGNSIVLLQRTAKDVDADTIVCSFYPTLAFRHKMRQKKLQYELNLRAGW